jgi:hypothetical protein
VTLAASVGYAASDYLDSPFRARTLTCGVGASRDIGDDLTLGLDIAYAKGSLISGDDVNGLVVMSSVAKRFSARPPQLEKGSGA